MAITDNAPDINYDDIVLHDENATPAINTSGYLTVLMTSINEYIQIEHKKGRITAKDYSTVYLGAIQSAIEQSTRFALEELLQNAKIELLYEQVIQTQKGNLKIDAEIDAIEADTARKDVKNAAEVKLITAQTNVANRQEDLLTEQVNTAAYELANLLPRQVEELVNKITLLDSQNASVLSDTINKANESTATVLTETERKNLLLEQVISETKNNGLNGILDKQVLKLAAEISLTNEQELKIIGETDNALNQSIATVNLTDEKTQSEQLTNRVAGENGETKDGVLQTDINKTKAEVILLDQKTLTEVEQTEVAIKQAVLYATQAYGFKAKHNQNLLKNVYDSWAVAVSVGTTEVDPNKQIFGINLTTLYEDAFWTDNLNVENTPPV